MQSIETGLRKKQKGIMDGLRRFIEMDNHSVLDVGHLRKGLKVQRPKFSENYLEVSKEGADDLTLRAEEVNTLRACINVDHIEENKFGPPVVDADCHAFCQATHEAIEGNEWEELYSHYREMSRAAGARKPSESQKAKALRAMKAGRMNSMI